MHTASRPEFRRSRRPSRKPNTSPQIMPRDRPLAKRQAMFQGAGMSAKRTRQISAAMISTRIATAPPLRPHFGYHLDAQNLGQRIAKHLRDHQCDLVLHQHRRGIGKACHRERPTKGVHGEIGAKRHQAAIEAKRPGGCAGKPSPQAFERQLQDRAHDTEMRWAISWTTRHELRDIFNHEVGAGFFQFTLSRGQSCALFL